MDDDTQKPVPFAHVYLEEQGIGTVTDLKGQFYLYVAPDIVWEKATVSCLGYQIQYIPYPSNDEVLTIGLARESTTLSKVTVLPISDRKMLGKASTSQPQPTSQASVA